MGVGVLLIFNSSTTICMSKGNSGGGVLLINTDVSSLRALTC